MRLGPMEIALLLAVVLLIFGPSKLPALGQGLAGFLKNLKRGLYGAREEIDGIKQDLKL